MTAKRIIGDMDNPNLPSMTEILPSDINKRVEAQGILDTERHLLQMGLENPPNDSFDNPPLIGNISPTPIVINGSISDTDRGDIYKFTVPPNNQNKINVTLSGLKELGGLSIFSIGNGNIATDFGYGRAEAGSDASVIIPENLKPGDYAVRVEWDGGFNVSRSTPYTLTLKGDSNATPSISTIAFSDANYTVNENGTKATITFKRNGPTGTDMRGIVNAESGTANPATIDEDYKGNNLELAFIPSDKDFGVLEIPIVNDNKQEGDETIKLSLRNGGFSGSPIGAQATAILTIKDDESGMPITPPITPPITTPTLGTPVSIVVPPINSPGPGNPTGQPANTARGQFYNLSDSDDNISLASIPAAAGKQILALSGRDNITGTQGVDNINGMQGADVINGGGGNDILSGGKESDNIDGAAGSDEILGGNDNDSLTGGDGNDTIRGGKENDVLNGGAGDDLLGGDRGQDILTGGPGNDTFILGGGVAASATLVDADVIADFTGGDKIALTDGSTFGGLTFETVSLSLNGGAAVSSTVIKLGTNYLGIVQGAAQSALTADVFVVL